MMWQSQLSLRAARKCVCSRVRYVIYRLYYTILISQRLSYVGQPAGPATDSDPGTTQ
jgi:hypothetical protein